MFDVPTTRALIERLENDKTLRRLCGWTYAAEIPSEATFSRAFAEFSESALPARVHEALIKQTLGDHLVGHVSRDSTAIEAREKPQPKPRAEKPKRKRGRPRKGEERPREERRVKRQLTMSLPQMLDDLPKACDVGTKRNAKGHTTSWIGYKLHIDAADGGIPISCILTSASLHDSQAAIPLASMTADRVTNLYDLMDSAYDAPEIGWHSYLLGHVPIIDINPRDKEYKEELAREAPGAERRRSPPPGGRALQRALEHRAHQRWAEGQLRGPPCPRARPCQGSLPPDVRHPGADGRPVDAPPGLSGRLRPCHAGTPPLGGGAKSHVRIATAGPECARMGIGLPRIGAPAAASDVRSSRSSCYVPTVNVLTTGLSGKEDRAWEFCKWLGNEKKRLIQGRQSVIADPWPGGGALPDIAPRRAPCLSIRCMLVGPMPDRARAFGATNRAH